MKLSEKIISCRKKLGMSQEELAQALGISRQSISKWETDESLPEINKLKKLSDLFGVSIDWLLADDDDVAENDADAENAQTQAEEAQTQCQNTQERYTEEEHTQQKSTEQEQTKKGTYSEQASMNTKHNYSDFIQGLIDRYGWLAGLRVAVGGVLVMIMGIAIRVIGRKIIFPGSSFSSSGSFPDSLITSNFEEIHSPLASTGYRMFSMIGNIALILGAVVIIFGIILIVVLRQNDESDS